MKLLHGLRIIIPAIFPVLFCVSGFSQEKSLRFRHISTQEGLSQNSVFSILEDSRGFMWFATDDGLNKYDGYKFTAFKHDPLNPRSISSSSINAILEDDRQNLWVVSAGGLDRFDRQREIFVHYRHSNPALVIRNIFQDSKKNIWLGTSDGLCLFNTTDNSFTFYKNHPKDPNSLSHNYVYRVVEDNDGFLWVATRNGLNRLDATTGKFKHYLNEPGNNRSIGSGYIKTLYKDLVGNIWVGTQGSGIALLDRQQHSFTNFRHDPLDDESIGHNDILSFAQDAAGRLWVGTENGGISILDTGTKKFTRHRNNEIDAGSLSSNSVYCLYKDNNSNMWAGTWAGGINFLPFYGNKFRHFKTLPYQTNSLSNNKVLSIITDSMNYVWIGTDGGGLNRFDPKTERFTRYTTANKSGIYGDYVTSITEYSKGVLALGFHRGGLDLFDTRTQQFTHYDPQDSNLIRLTSPTVNITYKDRRGNLWLGTHDNGGIYLFNEQQKNFKRFKPDPQNVNSIAGSVVHSMYESRAGELWIGGDRGLDLFNRETNTFTHHRHDPANKHSISNNFVYGIQEDAGGNLWLGTAGGLNYYNRKTNQFIAYTEKDGLANNFVCGTLTDRHGNVWLSTNTGLSRFDPKTRLFKNYSVHDGLQGSNFKPKACFQAADGEMFFGGVNGFNAFYPGRISENTHLPPVYLTGFDVFNKPVGIGEGSPLTQSINETKRITLSYKQTVFTLEFAALCYIQPAQNRYAYMLEGFDEEWNNAGNQRTATYTNLDPGTYTFKVRGSNNDGLWNNQGASVIIVILPPFWLTWWFLLVTVLAFIGSGAAFYWIRINQVKLQKATLEQKVREQTIELVHSNQQETWARFEAEKSREEAEQAWQEADLVNKKLQVKNRELEQFAYVASHDLQEPLRTAESFVKLLEKQYKGKLDEKGDKYLWYISDASSRMKILIRDLLDFSRIGHNSELKAIDCNVLIQQVVTDLGAAIEEVKADIYWSDLPVIYGYGTEIQLLFQNLVINSIKFRKKDIAPEVSISANKVGSFWQFAVKDNGIGIEKQHTDRIFDIFQRLHTRTEYEGSGIGLSHCKKIVEIHQGEIWIESIPGMGSIFYFTLLAENEKQSQYPEECDAVEMYKRP